MVYEVPHYINGQKINKGNASSPIYNPALGEVIGQVHFADQSLTDQAVLAAKQAFTTWSNTSTIQRAKIFFQFKLLLEKNIKDLAAIVTSEHGKTLEESIGSIRRGIDVVDFLCNIPGYLQGSYMGNIVGNMDTYSLLQPLGVCVGITPFNFPAMIPLWMFAMAIACGNTFILKPSEKDPSCAIKLVELAEEAGVPPGVINVVQGGKETVDMLITHPEVKAVSFVGSSKAAEQVYKKAIAHGKRAQAFGSAKNHCILMPDADLSEAAPAIMSSAYNCAGERCMAISVVIAVGDEIADQLIAKIKPLMEKIKIGPGVTTCDMGPLISGEHLEKVKEYIQLGQKEGATLVVENSGKKEMNEKGFFLGAYLFDHVKPAMRIYKEEIFGPVLSIMRVRTFEEALQLINAHEFGNGSSIFTRDGYIARLFSEKVEAGMVGINVPVPVPVAYQSFGGWKNSVFADIGMYGTEGIRFYTKRKTISKRWFAKETV